jgi:hypothetical protein
MGRRSKYSPELRERGVRCRSTRPITPRSGWRFDRSPRNSVAQSRRCRGGCGSANATASFSSRHRLDRHPSCQGATERRSVQQSRPNPLPRRLCRSRQRYIVRAHAFLRLAPPRWAFSSPLAFTSSRLVPNRKSGCRDHIALALRPTWRTATASPRTIPRHAGAQINQAAGHAIIWGGPLGVRCHAQGPRHGELSIPRWGWRVCAIDCIVRKRAHSQRVARRVVGKLFHLAWRTRHTPARQQTDQVKRLET